MDIHIKKLSPQDIHDFCELIRVFEGVFEMDDLKMSDEKHLRNLLGKPDFFALVAKYNNKVIGGLTVYILHSYYSTRPSAYIYDVGVQPGYQRKGIGKKLIAYLTNYCRENEFEDAFVESEMDDLQAVSFYRSTAFSNELQATHFTYLLRKANSDKINNLNHGED